MIFELTGKDLNLQIAKTIGMIFLLVKIIPCSLFAQSGSFWDDTDLQPFATSGTISFDANAYTADGIENRRSPTVLRTDVGVNVNTFGFRSGFNINYSTDDTGLRQNMNTISYSASWRWLNIQAGDINTRFSEYSLNGASLRGGYIRAEPGNFLIELIAGRAQRAVRPSMDQGFREPSFERWSGGAKLGIGRETGSYFHLSTYYSIDERASLSGEEVEIKAQENISITPDFKVDFFDGRFSVESEITVSAFTRDLGSSPIDLNEIAYPTFLSNIYLPRNTTRVNYAGQAFANFVSNPFDLTFGYERIQPGFISHGRSRARDDHERISLSPSFRMLNNRVNIQSNVVLGRDNLLGSRLQTQSETSINTNLQIMFTDYFSLNTNYDLFLNDVTPQDDQGFEQSQISHNIMLQPNFNFRTGDYSHTFSVSGSFMTIENTFSDDMQGDDSTLSETISGNINYSIRFPGGLSANLAGNYMVNSSGQADITNVGVNAGSSYSFFDRSLTLSINAGYSQNSVEREMFNGDANVNSIQQITGAINTSYRLSSKDSLTLSVRTRVNSVIEGAGSEYQELEGAFRYQRTF
ncbi:MAG: hypothetical protein JJU37_06535 [Balneolaceae bacterium]|nr:hypothetical protein [Balneolaceae bacterium]